eukprot:6117310-Amphidinium_carterae.1
MLQDPPSISLWVAVDPDQIPDEAVAVSGELVCPWDAGATAKLDGKTIGPFPQNLSHPHAEQADKCLLACMELRADPPPLYNYVAKDPSPLLDRCNELGGCEFQRLLSVPCVIGHFYPFPTPVRSLHFLTQCCKCSLDGVHVTINDTNVGTSDVRGQVALPKSRVRNSTIQLSGAPLDLLPGENGRVETSWKLP